MKNQLVRPKSHQRITFSLAGIFLFTLLVLSGCQTIQKSAKELRSNIDQTVQSTKEKADNIKKAFDDTSSEVKKNVDSVKTKVDQTKETIDTKVKQAEEAGTKIQEATNAVKDANQSVLSLTK